ncbi:LexA family transcriptional regulator [Aliivibrio finisterrensis]|uniref:LexA family transcriptional regulator n=1 Tax=Aliivibrio finisterrensis TaxID=511998 RepID=A0A4Q5K8C8_9GAMM|nr:S24 family peptidase [Aliivibrio finisterrensis]RYU42087.1 LexA family transcriptional regulator [Aliivibrio finisterrensis]
MTYKEADQVGKNDDYDPFESNRKGSISKRLIQLSENRTIRETAKIWGVSTATVSLYLKKGGMPSIDKALAIANGEGVSLDWLAYGEEEPVRANNDLVPITKYDITASAGGGSLVETEESSIVTVSRSWLRGNNLLNNDLCIIGAKGNSMEPSIHDGDELFIRMIQDSPGKPYDGVFVINIDDLLKVKRLEYSVMMDGYRVISDNTEYQEEFVSRSDIAERLKVVGEVVLVLGRPPKQQPTN